MLNFKTLAAVALACALGAAQGAPPPAEVFFKEADFAEATLSPSGRKLALTTALGAERRSLLMLDLGPGGKLVRIVQPQDADVVRVQWVNEDRLVFGAVDFSEGSGRATGGSGLFAVNPDGSELQQLVLRRRQPSVVTGSRLGRTLDWNHRLLRVPAPQPGEANEEVLVGHLIHGEPVTVQPMWLNTRTGRTRSLELDAPANVVRWLTDSRGEPRVAFTISGGRQAAHWRPPGSRAWTRLYESDLLSTPFDPHSVDDAGTLYVTRREGAAGLNVLTTYDAERRAPAEKALVVTAGFDFAGELIAPRDGRALGVRVTTDAEATVWFDARLKALQQDADTRLPGRVNRISCRRCREPDMVALVTSYSERDPGSLWLYQAKPAAGAPAWRMVGRLRKDVDPAQMATLDLHRIKARDGRDLPVWVTAPAGSRAGQPLPAVVLVHGGPWLRGGSWRWHAMTQFLASRGYLVIEPEFRGSTGFGEAHFKAGFRQWGQAARIRAPLLLAFGSNDRRVPLAHGERLSKALQAAGNEPEWVVYDGEGHGWAVRANKLDFAARVERFLAAHLLKD